MRLYLLPNIAHSRIFKTGYDLFHCEFSHWKSSSFQTKYRWILWYLGLDRTTHSITCTKTKHKTNVKSKAENNTATGYLPIWIQFPNKAKRNYLCVSSPKSTPFRSHIICFKHVFPSSKNSLLMLLQGKWMKDSLSHLIHYQHCGLPLWSRCVE